MTQSGPGLSENTTSMAGGCDGRDRSRATPHGAIRYYLPALYNAFLPLPEYR